MDSASALKLVLDDQLITKKVGELKAFLKSKGCSAAGDKGRLVWRIMCALDGEFLLVDGKNPAAFKPKELKMACCKRGLSVIGNNDEKLDLLMEYLRKEHPDKVVTNGNTDSNDATNGDSKSSDSDALEIARRIVELKEACDFVGILCVLGHTVTESSPTNVMRKAYLKISRLVHPDKLSGEDATKAFQATVYAFERLTKPELFLEEETTKKGKKAKKISRSNVGCKRTRIFCPRCDQEWGKAVDGVPKYTYNFFMQALKTYHCSTCLLDFGCMTAIHQCPFCKYPFEYTPADYHRKITCTNARCTIPFGFHMYHVSNAIEKQLRKEIKLAQEKRLKREAAKKSRAERKKRKHGAICLDAKAKRREQIRWFKRGLLDSCPLCGFTPEGDGEEAEHLRMCKKNKESRHAYKVAQREAKKIKEAKEKKIHSQVEAQNLASWEYLGAQTANIWLLTMEQLKKQCQNEGIDDTGDKDDLIMRLHAHRAEKDSRLLTDGTTTGKGKRAKKLAFTRESLPENLHSISMKMITTICVSHGFYPKSETKDDLIEEIEKQFEKDTQLLLK